MNKTKLVLAIFYKRMSILRQKLKFKSQNLCPLVIVLWLLHPVFLNVTIENREKTEMNSIQLICENVQSYVMQVIKNRYKNSEWPLVSNLTWWCLGLLIGCKLNWLQSKFQFTSLNNYNWYEESLKIKPLWLGYVIPHAPIHHFTWIITKHFIKNGVGNF